MIKHMRIAVADGDAENRRYYERILPQMGHTVVGTADSEVDLMELCRNRSPDLVIVDEMLPGLGRKGEKSYSIPTVEVPLLIVSSSDTLQEDHHDGNSRCVQYLVRPFKTDDLESAIESASPHKAGLNTLYD